MPPCRVSRRDRLVLGDSKGVLERGGGCTEEELEAPGGWEGGDVRQRTQQGNVTEREQLPGWQLRGGGGLRRVTPGSRVLCVSLSRTGQNQPSDHSQTLYARH